MEPLLEVHTSVLDDVAVARLSGELDLSGACGLLADLRPAVEQAGRAVVVDLRGLTFLDCSGVTALVEAREAIQPEGVELVLAAPTRPVARLLSLTGTGRLVPIFRTVRQAVNHYHVTTGRAGARSLPPPRRGGLGRPGVAARQPRS
jgi:anti-sigma B factor antagonist